jgi:hypothetical protein
VDAGYSRAVKRLALVLLACAAGCGGGRTAAESVATKKVAAPPAQGFGDDQPLKSGKTYVSRVFKPSLRFTVPAGSWVTEVGDNAPSFSIAAVNPRPPLTQAILAVHRVKSVFDAVRGGKRPGDVVPLHGDFATWLRRHPHLVTTAPKRVAMFGLPGVQLDVTARSSPPVVPEDCGKVGPGCVPLLYDGRDFVFYAKTTKGRFTVLNLPGGGQLVVERFAEFTADRKHALDRALRILHPLLAGMRLAS